VKIKVKLFASYRDLAGKNDIELDLNPGSTVTTVLIQLKELFPKLSERLSANTLIALNTEYASPTHPIQDGDEIAIFPPVSGGVQ
jgi:MoaD family protein